MSKFQFPCILKNTQTGAIIAASTASHGMILKPGDGVGHKVGRPVCYIDVNSGNYEEYDGLIQIANNLR